MAVVVCSHCRTVNDEPGDTCRNCGRPIHRSVRGGFLSPRPAPLFEPGADPTGEPFAPESEHENAPISGVGAQFEKPGAASGGELSEPGASVSRTAPGAADGAAEVAPPGSRAPIRIVSVGEIPRVVVRAAPTPSPVKPETRDLPFRPEQQPGTCRRCGRENPAESWFCAGCGEPLRPLPSARRSSEGGGGESTPTPTGLLSPSGKVRRGAFRRALHGRGANHRWVVRYDRPLAGRVLAFRGLLGTIAAAAVVVALLPSASPLRGRAEQPFEGKLQAAAVRSASIDRPAALIAGHPPGDAVDGNPKTAWMVGWKLGPVQENDQGPCSETRIPAYASLVINFARPDRLAGVSVAAGPGASSAAHQVQPRIVDLAFSDGRCDRLTLADTAATQSFHLSTGPEQQVTLNLVAGYPPPGSLSAGAAGQGFVSIREITFVHRG